MDPLNLFLEFTNICRLCLSQDHSLVKIFPETDQGTDTLISMSSKIIACVGIQVQDDDNLPDKVCERCIKEIENWTQFKQICDNANTLLLQSAAGLSPLQNQILQNNLNGCQGENLDCILSTPSVFDERLASEAESFFQKIDEKHLPSLLSADSLSSVFIDGDNVDQNETITLYRVDAENSTVQTPCQIVKEVKEVVNRQKSSLGMNLNINKELIVGEPEAGIEDIMVITRLEGTGPEKFFENMADQIQPTGKDSRTHVLKDSDLNVEHSTEQLKDINTNLLNSPEIPKQTRLLKDKNGLALNEDSLYQPSGGTKENKQEQVLNPKVNIRRNKWLEKYNKIYQQKYDCGFCPRVFSKFSDLKKHDKIDHGFVVARDKCGTCGHCFISKGRLDFHRLLRHREKEFVCIHCDFKSVSKKSLRYHIQYTHIKEYSLDACHICGRRYRSKSNLMNHMKKHESPKFSCDICGKLFRQSQTLTRHYNNCHSHYRDFECDICSKTFKSLHKMQIHKQCHNPTLIAVCDICGLSYKNEMTLTIHKKTHEEKKHSCPVCSKSFTTKNLLNRHQNIHNNLRKYTCEVCDKCFNRADVLKSHLLIHGDDVKPFKCNFCNLTFRFKRYLRVHLNSMHKKAS